ncbi:MAG: DUF309 domain-containing protein [Rubrobacter sp.]
MPLEPREPLSPLVRRGVSEFNRRRFYECHEYLEDAWREEESSIRLLYQGILQIGVGFHHQRTGNWYGAVRLIAKGLDKLDQFEPETLGIDVSRLRRETRTCLGELRRLGSERIAEFDGSQIPVILTSNSSNCPDTEEPPHP